MLYYEYNLTQRGSSMKPSYTKNIKVNIYVRDFLSEESDKKIRTSTTLNYQICDHYFSRLHRKEADKLRKSKKTTTAVYRKWLTGKAQEWANEQCVAISTHLEDKMLYDLTALAFKEGLEKNRDNLGLDV